PGATAVQRHELAHHGEADAGARHGRAAVALEPPELVPDALAVGGGNARALVVHTDARPALVYGEAKGDGLTGRPVLHRVVEQVEEHLTQRVGVDRRYHTVGEVGAQPDAPRASERGEPFGGFAQERCEWGRGR